MTEILPNHVYEHHKGGKYLVLGIADDSTNDRPNNKVVVYISLAYGKLKVRDLHEFVEIVQWPSGERKPRFVPEL